MVRVTPYAETGGLDSVLFLWPVSLATNLTTGPPVAKYLIQPLQKN